MKLLKAVKKFSRYFAIFRKKKVLFITILAIVVVFGFFLYYRSYLNPPIPGIILFEGDECAQCERVETYIKNNKVEEKVVFTRLEVFNNNANISLLEDKAQKCGLDSSHIGVPFLWDGEHCIIGYIDVIEFFRQKISKK